MEEKMEQQVQEAVEPKAQPDVVGKVAEVQAKERLVIEAKKEARILELKDEIERLETGLPNARTTIQAIKDKQQKIPGRKPNTPDVNPGNVDEITAQEVAKYGSVLGPMAGMGTRGAIPGMTMPGMAAQPGAQEPMGVQRPVGPQRQATPLLQESKPRTVQLDPKTLLEVELVSVKKRLAEANERLSLVALNDARKAKFAAEQQEAELMATISQQLGIPPGKNVRLVDKQKGICVIEE